MQTSAFNWSIRGITYAALFGALFVAFTFIQIPLGFTPVQITLANFAIMLTGALLGGVYGFISIGAVVLLTAIGLPLLHGAGGIALLTGRTAGFIWAYPFAALFIGLIASRIRGRGWKSFVLLFLTIEIFGSLLLYVTGIPWFAHVTHYSLAKSLSLSCYPFLPGDAAKALLATLIVHQIRVVFPEGILTRKSSPVVPLDT